MTISGWSRIGGLVAALWSAAALAWAAEAPRGLAGFQLGEDIGRHRQRCKMGTALPIRYLESVQEVEVDNLEGYKSGLIAYGTCAAPDRILRIKLKYADPSREFFEALLTRFKARYGSAAQWRGDPFHVVIAWKWSFRDPQGNTVSLTLQHNSQDEEEKMGNSVKLSLTNLLAEERDCRDRAQGADSAPLQTPARLDPDAIRWERFVPQ